MFQASVQDEVIDRAQAGDLVFFLSQLAQDQLPVAPGLVIPDDRFRDFLARVAWVNPLLADLPDSFFHLQVNDPWQLQHIAQEIYQDILKTPLPQNSFATLTKAIAAWNAPGIVLWPSLYLSEALPADQQAAIELLDCQVCQAHPLAISIALKRLWAELFKASTLFYWHQRGLTLQQTHLNMLVQPLYPTTWSGEAEVTADLARVQSVWGPEFAIQDGLVIPDRDQINWQTGQLLKRQPGHRGYGYQITDPDSQSATWARTIAARQGLLIQPLPDDRQHTPPFSDWDLPKLCSLLTQAQTRLGDHFKLTWRWQTSQSGQPAQLHLTQAIALNSIASSWWGEAHPGPALYHTAPINWVQKPALAGTSASGGQITAIAQVVTPDEPFPETGAQPYILVANQIHPHWMPWLAQVAGFITEQGGVASHAAILAREIGIPALVAVAGATQWIKTGDRLHLDGNQGVVNWVSSDTTEETDFPGSQSHHPTTVLTPLSQSSRPSEPRSVLSPLPHRTKLMVNLSQSQQLAPIADLPVNGVGLLRSDLLWLTFGQRGTPEDLQDPRQKAALARALADQVRSFAAAFKPRPVFYRALDWLPTSLATSHQTRTKMIAAATLALGQRGTFQISVNPIWFDLELAVLAQLRQQGYDNLHLLLPFVRTVEEFIVCRQRAIAAGLEPGPTCQIWIMAEVPSVLFLLPEYVQAGVQGIAIGSNDFTQLLLGADREQDTLAQRFTAKHPAVRRAIAQLIQQARNLGIPSSLCGQAIVQFPELIPELIQQGITALSVEPAAIGNTQAAILQAEAHLNLDASGANPQTSLT